MTDKNKFHGGVGRFLSGKDARSRTARYRNYKHSQGCAPDSFTRAEFFGIDRINKLLTHTECVGIRIYYGKSHEDKNGNTVDDESCELKSRMVLVGVRSDGTDIFEDTTGKKDPEDGSALGDGHECPQHCGRPPGAL